MEKEKTWAQRYLEKFGGELVPMMEVQGNEIFYEKYNYNTELLYMDCVEKNKRWEDILKFKYDQNVLY